MFNVQKDWKSYLSENGFVLIKWLISQSLVSLNSFMSRLSTGYKNK